MPLAAGNLHALEVGEMGSLNGGCGVNLSVECPGEVDLARTGCEGCGTGCSKS